MHSNSRRTMASSALPPLPPPPPPLPPPPPIPVPLEQMTNKQLRALLKQKGMQATGGKAVLIERLKNGPQPVPFEKMKVKELQSLLKQQGLPVTGRKPELIERLKMGPIKGPKPKPWQHCQAKKDLKRALLDSTSPIHGMSMDAIRNADARYKQYPNFPKYYEDLKVQVAMEKKNVREDDVAVEEFMKNNPRSDLNKRGYPHWDTHAAKKLLEVDVANGLHEKMKPRELRRTREEYKEFPRDVFVKRVNREVDKQRCAEFWAFKRNKRGMKNS